MKPFTHVELTLSDTSQDEMEAAPSDRPTARSILLFNHVQILDGIRRPMGFPVYYPGDTAKHRKNQMESKISDSFRKCL